MVEDNPTWGLIMAKRTARWNLTERWRLKTALDIPALLITLLTLHSWWIISHKMILGSFSSPHSVAALPPGCCLLLPKDLGVGEVEEHLLPLLLIGRHQRTPLTIASGLRWEVWNYRFELQTLLHPTRNAFLILSWNTTDWPAGPTSPASLAATTAPLTPAPKRRQVAAAVLHLNILFWSIDRNTYNVQTYVWDIKIFVQQQCSLITWLPCDCCNTTTQLDFYLLLETGLCPLALWSPESQLILYYTHRTYYTICRWIVQGRPLKNTSEFIFKAHCIVAMIAHKTS